MLTAYQGTGSIGVYAMNIDSGYITYNFKAMNFVNIPLQVQGRGKNRHQTQILNKLSKINSTNNASFLTQDFILA